MRSVIQSSKWNVAIGLELISTLPLAGRQEFCCCVLKVGTQSCHIFPLLLKPPIEDTPPMCTGMYLNVSPCFTLT